MDFLQITDHDYLASCLEGPISYHEMISWHWYQDILRYERGYFYRDKKTYLENNISFILDDEYINLSNSFIEVEPKVELLSYRGGERRTLTMAFKSKFPHSKIVGDISILNKLNSSINTEYQLEVKDVKVKTIVGLFICQDGFDSYYFKHIFENKNLSLTYKSGSQVVSLFDKVTDKNKRLLLENYILERCMKEVLFAIENAIMNPLHDRGYVSNEVGADYSLRNVYRIYEKKMRVAFNIFIDKILDIANELIEKEKPKIFLSKIFGLLNGKKGKQTLKSYKASISILNSLERVKNPIILPENNLIYLYIPVDFKELHLNIEEEGKSDMQIFNTMDSCLQISLKKLDKDKVEIHLLDFNINEFRFSSTPEINFILNYEESFKIEEKVKEYFERALKDEELNILAIHPPNVEIDYDSDDFMAEDSEEE